MVEGGAILQGSFLQEGLADELHVYIGACMLGSTSKRWAQTELTGTIADARFWRLLGVEQFGDDVCLKYVRKQGQMGE